MILNITQVITQKMIDAKRFEFGLMCNVVDLCDYREHFVRTNNVVSSEGYRTGISDLAIGFSKCFQI